MSQSGRHSFNHQVELETLIPAFRLVRGSSLSSLLAPLIVVVVMWPRIDHYLLVGWGLLVVAGLVTQYFLTEAFLRQDIRHHHVRLWGRRLSAVYLYFGLLWVAAIFLFNVDGQMEYQLFLLTLVVTLSLGTLVVGQYWFPMFLAFGPVTMAAVVVRLFMEGTLTHGALAVLLLWAGLGTLLFAKTLHNTVRSEIRLRHEASSLNTSLESKVSEAQQATIAKSKFLAAASHDLRQPLHTLSLFLDVLKDSDSEKERAAIFSRIDLSLEALSKLFDALLDISRLDAGVVKAEFSHFDVSEVLTNLAQEFRPAARRKNLKIRVRAGKLFVMSDRLLLERILRNLMSNAIRYTDKGGVLLAGRLRGEQVMIQVWDTGVGIPEECQEEIFVEFHQLHNPHRDRSEGLGLGLALVRGLCRLLNCDLELNSIPGKGTVFSLMLPAGKQESMDNRCVSARLRSWDLSGRRVLVIDDEKDVLVAMQSLLSKWGCRPIVAESEAEAIHKLKQQDLMPDLILSDLRLSGDKNGIQVLDDLRQHFNRPIPAVLITGDTAPDRLMLARHSQYEVLQKPVRPAHLRSVIQHLMSEINS